MNGNIHRKIPEIAGNPLSFSRYSVIRKDKRECFKREKIWQSAAKLCRGQGRFRDYNRNYQFIGLVNGIVHSFWKHKVAKKPQVPVQFGGAQHGNIFELTV